MWWVDLAPLLDDETLVAQCSGEGLGVREAPNQTLLETLVRFLQARELLLVLDNCEHLVDACAQLANAAHEPLSSSCKFWPPVANRLASLASVFIRCPLFRCPTRTSFVRGLLAAIRSDSPLCSGAGASMPVLG